jgi:uncharacterized delta-60 repeat protein
VAFGGHHTRKQPANAVLKARHGTVTRETLPTCCLAETQGTPWADAGKQAHAVDTILHFLDDFVTTAVCCGRSVFAWGAKTARPVLKGTRIEVTPHHRLRKVPPSQGLPDGAAINQEIRMNPKSLAKYAVLCCAILIVVTASAAGQAGHLDNTFGNSGIARQQTVVNQTTNFYSVGGAVIQSDGKIVVVGGVPGSTSFTVPAVLRFLSNGGLDKTFGSNGIFVLPNSFGSFASGAIQTDGKILIGTSAAGPNAEVDRLTTSGHLDSSFGSGGRVSFNLTALLGMALQPDGGILASLQSIIGGTPKVTRLLSNGSTDTSFGTNGFAFPPGGAGALEVLGNGDILVFGGLISRLTSFGAMDPTFGVNAQLLAPTSGHASAANGDILVAGTLISEPTVPTAGLSVFAYHSIGIGDPAFGRNGGVLTAFAGFPMVTAEGLSLESTGDIVELGTVATRLTGAFGLVRYTSLGQIDTTFGSSGIVTTSFGNNATVTASAIGIQSDDKVVVAGTVSMALLHGQFSTSLVVARYLAK